MRVSILAQMAFCLLVIAAVIAGLGWARDHLPADLRSGPYNQVNHG